MKHFLCLTIVATAAAQMSISGCSGQQGDPPKPAVIENRQVEQKNPPKTPMPEPPKNFTNSIGMKFVWIPPGNFMMGSPKEEKERQA